MLEKTPSKFYRCIKKVFWGASFVVNSVVHPLWLRSRFNPDSGILKVEVVPEATASNDQEKSDETGTCRKPRRA